MNRMTGHLTLPKNQEIVAPEREADYSSPRGVHYWWAPDWVRHSPGSKNAFGRVLPVRVDNTVALHSISKAGKITYIRGRIQFAFQDWYRKNQDIKVWSDDINFDCLFLDEDPRDVLDINWDLKQKEKK